MVTEVIWLHRLFSELYLPLQTPISVFCGSRAALQIAANPVFHERTKHLDVDCYFVRERYLQHLISLFHISTTDQPADIFTKALSRSQHDHLCSKLGLFDVFQPPP